MYTERTNDIKVAVRTNYGVEHVYPVCGKAQAFARIAGTSTLTPATLREVSNLGYGITIVAIGSIKCEIHWDNTCPVDKAVSLASSLF